MGGPKDLETRIRILEDIEAIRKLKFNYWLCVDNKRWTDLADCLAEDLVFDLSGVKTEGRKNFIRSVRGLLDRGSIVSSHQGHQSNIEITSERTAKGSWAFRDVIINSQTDAQFKGRAYYDEEYEKEKGEWKIKRIKISYVYSEGRNREYDSDAPNLLKQLRDKKEKSA